VTENPAEREQAADLARELVEQGAGAPPTDSLPEDAGPPWLTIGEIFKLPVYREGVAAITSGFAGIDDALRGGLRPESVYIVAGRTGAAKSTLALNVARRTALAGVSVLLFKLEESPCEAVWRIHAAASQVDMIRLLDGAKLASDERQKLIDGWTLIRSLPIRVSDQRNIVAIERIAELHASDSGGLVVIDQLSMIDCPGRMTAYERATEISGRLRLLARRLRVPVLLIAQVNRPASKGKERLTCNDLRDSGALENDAAAVLLIDRVRIPDVPRWHTDPLTLEIIVGKNRYGHATRDDDSPMELLWWPWCCRIEDAARPHGGAP
jgi:replicative DNA helicase